MSTFHYDSTPLPVGNPVRMNGSGQSYALGLYDGANYSAQFRDDPEVAVLFESPEGARRWLEVVQAVLSPCIESGDRAARVPNADGWADS